jgi:hypothetical protein
MKIEIKSYKELKNLIVSSVWYLQTMCKSPAAFEKEKDVFLNRIIPSIMRWLEIPKLKRSVLKEHLIELCLLSNPLNGMKVISDLSTVAKLRWQLEMMEK